MCLFTLRRLEAVFSKHRYRVVCKGKCSGELGDNETNFKQVSVCCKMCCKIIEWNLQPRETSHIMLLERKLLPSATQGHPRWHHARSAKKNAVSTTSEIPPYRQFARREWRMENCPLEPHLCSTI